MMDAFEYFSPVFIFTRYGWEGVFAVAVGVFLALSAVVIAVRKPLHGDILIYGFARAQFLICLLWLNNCIIYSFFCLSAAFGKGGTALWLHNETYAIAGAAFQLVLLTVALLAGMIRYRTTPVLTAWDVLGLSAATLSVALNVMVKNATCTMMVE